jgi:hypothetical protein
VALIVGAIVAIVLICTHKHHKKDHGGYKDYGGYPCGGDYVETFGICQTSI